MISLFTFKDHKDEYRGKLEPVIPNLLDAGVLFLLRWSLDDHTLAVISSSLHAIRALVMKEEDEVKIVLYVLSFKCLSVIDDYNRKCICIALSR